MQSAAGQTGPRSSVWPARNPTRPGSRQVATPPHTYESEIPRLLHVDQQGDNRYADRLRRSMVILMSPDSHMRQRGTEVAPATRHLSSLSHLPTPWRLNEISPTPDSRISHRHAETPLMRWIPLLRQTATAITLICVTIKRSPPERCAAASETTIV